MFIAAVIDSCHSNLRFEREKLQLFSSLKKGRCTKFFDVVDRNDATQEKAGMIIKFSDPQLWFDLSILEPLFHCFGITKKPRQLTFSIFLIWGQL